MTDLHRLLDQIGRTHGCTVASPNGQPVLRESERLPDDVAEFYRLVGGVSLFEDGEYPMRVLGPDEFIRANPEIARTECPDDITDSWYIVAQGGRVDSISIDCSPARIGRCYDSFWDRHGVVGECLIVALSFTELLQRLFDGAGGYYYWLASDPGYGDAYAGEPDQG